MRYSYNKLWYLLVDRKMSRTELRKQAGITTNVLANLGQNRPVSIEPLAKICTVLNCTFNDIISFEPDTEDKTPDQREYF